MNLGYIQHHLTGAWQLLRGDEDGLDHFDLTEEGFWRSFGVMVLIVPFLFVSAWAGHGILSEFAATDPTLGLVVPPVSVYMIVELVTTYVGWVAYLMVMVPLARAFGAPNRYSVFVVAYNWANLLILLLFLPLYLSWLFGFLSTDFLLSFEVFLGLAFLVYGWFVAVVSLKASRLDAAAVVATEFVIFLGLNSISRGIYGAFPIQIA